jgi:hypothetical protein
MVERRVLGRERHPQLEFRAFDLAFANDALELKGDSLRMKRPPGPPEPFPT